VAVLLILCGCGGWDVPLEAKQWKNPVAVNSATLADAHAIYAQRCAKCHGANGDGKRPPGSSYMYTTQPTNFTNAGIVDAMTDGEIFWKISHGRRPMPSFRNVLTDEQRWELVNLLRQFAHPAQPSP
jgi:mono/diheme cytochrome c family protein